MNKYLTILILGNLALFSCATAQRDTTVSANLESQVRAEIKIIDAQLQTTSPRNNFV